MNLIKGLLFELLSNDARIHNVNDGGKNSTRSWCIWNGHIPIALRAHRTATERIFHFQSADQQLAGDCTIRHCIIASKSRVSSQTMLSQTCLDCCYQTFSIKCRSAINYIFLISIEIWVVTKAMTEISRFHPMNPNFGCDNTIWYDVTLKLNVSLKHMNKKNIQKSSIDKSWTR